MKTNIIGTLVIIAIIVLLVMRKNKKIKNSAWKGEVIKKKCLSDEEDINHVYKLVFRTDAGKKEQLNVTETMYDETKIGDRYEKIAGDNTPKKI